jgi:hypothetical protein
MEHAVRITAKQLVLAAVVLVLVLVIGTWQWRATEERRRAEEIATAEGLAQLLSATFSGQTDLKVSNIQGRIDVTSVNRGRIFDSRLQATLPYSIDYFVDLSKLGARNAKFDSQSRTLMIEVPDVRVASPNVDLTRGTVGNARGFWVSRRASANLVRRAVSLTNQQAEKTAKSPENLNRARNEARVRIQRLLELPLKAAGQDDVQVVVRFPHDGVRDSEHWDVSPSIEDVLANRA